MINNVPYLTGERIDTIYRKNKQAMQKDYNDSMVFSYSNVFFAHYFNDEVRCHKMIENHALMYLYSGELLVEEGNKQTKIHSGQCIFIRKDNRVTLTKKPSGDEQFRTITLVLTRNFLREFFQTMNRNEFPSNVRKFKQSLIKLPKTPEIESLFQSMTPYFDSSVKPREQIMKLKMQEGVYSLLNIDKDFYSCLFDFTEPWKIDILDFMENNYMYDMDVEDFANYTGRSLASFKRDFKKISPVSPRKWLIGKRLKVAHDKIRNENGKVSEVYLEVGFKNLSHFSTAFKKQYGYSPSK
jgi:AraC family transcriptional regulator, exoenzyme S synthesis regulatory protein ExsA